MFRFFYILFLFFQVSFTSEVHVLNTENFHSKIKEFDVVLVKFFAPWCGHCKRLAPDFEDAALILSAHIKPVHLAKLDCTENKDICDKYKVSGYPTLKIFKDGVMHEEFSGERSANGIVDYMKEFIKDPSYEISSETIFDQVFSDSTQHNIILGLFKDADSDSSKIFHQFSQNNKAKYNIAHSYNPEVFKRMGFDDDKVIIMRPKVMKNIFEEEKVVLNEVKDGKSLIEFVQDNILGLVAIRTMKNIDLFNKPLCVSYYDVDYINNAKSTNYFRNRVLIVADKMKDVRFAISNKKSFANELDSFGDLSNRDPFVACYLKQNKYAMTEKFSDKNLLEFVKSVLSGEVEPYLKSEAIPENPEGGVQVAVAKNFESVVMDPKFDVLVEFYAPWCGHCKKLTPIYEKLASKMANEPNIRIVKIDATANDIPPLFDVKGFPTLYWVPMDKKSKPSVYEGGRELKRFYQIHFKRSNKTLNRLRS